MKKAIGACPTDPASFTWFDLSEVYSQAMGAVRQRWVGTEIEFSKNTFTMPFPNTAIILGSWSCLFQDEGDRVTVASFCNTRPKEVAAVLELTATGDYEVTLSEGVPELLLKSATTLADRTAPLDSRRYAELAVNWFVITVEVTNYVLYENKIVTSGAQLTRKKPKKGERMSKPLYDWKTIEIPLVKPEQKACNSTGTGTPKRPHARRGTWCTSKLGTRYWRSATIINRHKEGFIFHDYQVKPLNGENA